jgi:hypothetical protein
MICRTCAQAADQQADRDAHCDATGGPDSACCCAHRTDRYRTRQTTSQQEKAA